MALCKSNHKRILQYSIIGLTTTWLTFLFFSIFEHRALFSDHSHLFFTTLNEVLPLIRSPFRRTEWVIAFPAYFTLKTFLTDLPVFFYLSLFYLSYFLPVIFSFLFFLNRSKANFSKNIMLFFFIINMSISFAGVGDSVLLSISWCWILTSLIMNPLKSNSLQNIFFFVFSILLTFTYELNILLLLTLLYLLIHQNLRRKIRPPTFQCAILIFGISIIIFSLMKNPNTHSEARSLSFYNFHVPEALALGFFFTPLLQYLLSFQHPKKFICILVGIFLLLHLNLWHFLYTSEMLSGLWRYRDAKIFALLFCSLTIIYISFNQANFDFLQKKFACYAMSTFIAFNSISFILFEFSTRNEWSSLRRMLSLNRSIGCNIIGEPELGTLNSHGANTLFLPHLSVLLQNSWHPKYILFAENSAESRPCHMKYGRIGYLEFASNYGIPLQNSSFSTIKVGGLISLPLAHEKEGSKND